MPAVDAGAGILPAPPFCLLLIPLLGSTLHQIAEGVPVLRARVVLALFLLVGVALLNMSCGGGTAAKPLPLPIGVTLSPSALRVVPDGTPASVEVTVTRPAGTSRAVTLTLLSVPAGVTAAVQSPGAGSKGTLTFSATAQEGGAGTYQVRVRADDGESYGVVDLALTVIIVARVGTLTAGRIDTFMSTSFQPASWSDDFFDRHPDTSHLDDLRPQHINVQVLERDIPQLTAWTPTSPDTWDFQFIDRMLNPIFTAGDRNPLYQIAMGPPFMYSSPGELRDVSYQEFAEYCAKLVKYYNTGGFVDGSGVFHVSTSDYPITYWGIYNEPNINGFTATEYVNMYNVVVPAMLAEDPTIKSVAVELADFGTEPQKYMPTFVANVTAPVDIVATHFYSTCNQRDTDQTLFNTVPDFVNHIDYIYSTLQSNPTLANVPVWLTENNVNADWSNNGISVCNGGPFVTDQRGSSAFFAAWRPLVFSKFSQAGIRAIHHWGFAADRQYGEVDGGTAQLYLSYWVDYWLARYFPSPPGSDRLELDATDHATVEILPTLSADGTVVIMIANHAVRSSSDDNGTGAPRTVLVDLSELGSFSSATQLTIDANTNPASIPSPQTITPATRMEITLSGYGVTFLALGR
jgi:hypothetical protein